MAFTCYKLVCIYETGKLKNIKVRPRLLRVYGSRVEHHDFPIPRQPLNPTKEESATESQSSEDLRDITLHFRIRQEGNPKYEEILSYDRRFKEHKDEVTEDEINKYISTITAAAMFEVENTDIILCTCVAASAPKFMKCYIKQVSIIFQA